jgi:hypothetical protein
MPEQYLTPAAIASLLRSHSREAKNLAARIADPSFEGNSFDSALASGRLRQMAEDLALLAQDVDAFALDDARQQR